MDPNAAWEHLNDLAEAGELEEAAHVAADLVPWIAKGGFPPKGMTSKGAIEACSYIRDTAVLKTQLAS